MSVKVNRQTGVAMLTAVMVVAFASTVAAALMVQQNLAVHRSGNLFQQDQAWWYVVGLEEWSATLLDRDLEDNDFDHLGEAWAQPVDFLPVDEGALAGALVDRQGCFNLRTLVKDGVADEARKQQLTRLLQGIDDLKPGMADDLVTVMVDWMDADTEPGFPGGAEDGIYLAKDPPYRTPNLPMESVTELRLLAGLEDPKILAAVLPHLCVRPGDHKINVNTASAPVLMSLSEKMTPAEAETIMQTREDRPYEKVENFISETVIAGMGINGDDLTTATLYFELQAAANIGNVRVSYSSLFERLEGKKTRVVAHSRNSL
jgi:general secretion pathway protein K